MSVFARAAAILFFLAGAVLLLLAQFSLSRSAGSVSEDRLARERAAILPAAASRLALRCVEMRVARVSEESSRSFAGAFHHRTLEETLDGYRSSGGDAPTAAAIAAWAAGLPSTDSTFEERSRLTPAGDLMLLPALRRLESESAHTPAVPAAPSREGSTRGRLQLAGALAAFALSLLCAGVLRR